jgi:predicted RNA-binding protein with PUA-like domain
VGKEVVGIVEVIREFYPDPTDETGKFGVVDLKAVCPLKTFVTLAEVKTIPALSTMSLLTSARLSVQPVKAAEWKLICKMGGVAP